MFDISEHNNERHVHYGIKVGKDCRGEKYGKK